jgi:NodT family efflux transporter outer membrane factor (OMF) lipoprotein
MAVLALSTAAAGCATNRVPREAVVGLPGSFESGAGVALPQASLDRWWTLYGDPELEGLVEQALVASPTQRAAAARLEEARAVRQAVSAGLYPQGNLEGNGTYTETEQIGGEEGAGGGGFGGGLGGNAGGQGGFSSQGGSRSATLNFPVSWEIDLFGRRRAAVRAANADLAAARFDAEATRAQLAADVADSLFQARGLVTRLEDAEATVRIQSELVRVVRRRIEVGFSAGADAARVEADLATAEAEAAGLEADLRAAKRSLLVLVGRSTEPTEALALRSVANDPPPQPTALPGALLTRRPDVREAQARLASAAGSLTQAELDFFPRFTLLPGLGLSSQGSDSFSSDTVFGSLGVGLGVPILDRPRLRAQLRGQEARTEQAVIAYEQAVQTAFSEAERTLVQLNADRSRTALLTGGEQSARTAYDAARRRYQLGLEDLQTVLDAERVWRGNRSALTQARVQALQRSVQVFKALGGGWSAATVTTAAAR